MSHVRSAFSHKSSTRQISRRPAELERLFTAQTGPMVRGSQAEADPRTMSAQTILALQGTAGNRAVQRLIQKKPSGGAADENYEDKLEGQLKETTGRGQPLPTGPRRFMEARFGADFSRVRVHTDDKATELSQSVSAQAFTAGRDIYFDKAHYSPASTSGQHLLAHELTHVVQQGGTDGRANNVQANTIQRYTLVGQYRKQVRGPLTEHQTLFNKMFKKQRLNTEVDNTVPNQRTYKLNREEGHFEPSPELKVSENGLLAMEHTTDQPKVFYAHKDVVNTSRKRLKDIGSRITLQGVPTKKLKVPQKPDAPNNMTNSLVMVKPAKMDPNQLNLMDISECNSVASKIIGPAKLVASGSGSGTHYSEYSVGSSGPRAVKALTQMPEQGPKEFSKQLRNVDEKPRHIKNSIAKKFKAIKKECNLHDNILIELSRPETPPYVIEQVYRAYVGKTPATKPNTSTMRDYIVSQQVVPTMQNYGNMVRDDLVPKELGLNQDAKPEVGEAFSIAESGEIIPIEDEYGVFHGNFDFTSTNPGEQHEAIQSLQTLQEVGSRLNKLHVNLFTNYKKATSFREHHGAVVARDGADSVTFENYNRTGEDRLLHTARWEQLAQDFEEFKDEIEQDIEEVRNADGMGSLEKMTTIQEIKKRQILKLKNNLTQVQGDTFVQFQSNFDTVSTNDLWYFRMYGPKEKAQSFHDVWSPSIKNPVTFRTAGRVDKVKVQEFKQKLDLKINAKRQLIAGNQTKEELLSYLESVAYENLDKQDTTAGASQAYRDLLEQIEQFV